MFDWPAASVVLGVLGTITVAVIKIAPRRPAAPRATTEYARATEVALVLGELRHINERLARIERTLDQAHQL